MGEFYIFLLLLLLLFRLTAYSLRKPFTKLKKKIDVHSVFKNGFIQRTSLLFFLFRLFLFPCGLDVAARQGYFCSVRRC